MTAKIKLNAASGGGSISIQAPSSSSNNRVIDLPDIADGTLLTSQSSLDSTKLSPAISAGITEADAWKINTTFDQQAYADITSNWSRATWGTGSLHGYKGTGMTESSGIFTFPSTGYWYVEGRLGYHARTGVSSGVGLYMKGTSDNSNYFDLATAWDTAVFQSGYYEWGHMNCSTIIDVTSTTNCKVKFRTEASNNQVKFYSTAGGHNNNFIFLRIGDT